MTPRPHLGLVALGGAGWLGGAAYIRNLARAIRAADPTTRVSFVCSDSRERDWRDDGAVVRVPIDRRRGWQRLFEPGKPRLDTILRDAAIDFLYPLTFDNRSTLGLELPVKRQLRACRWAGWIPDFQHRHLPQLFSRAELEFRERHIAHLAADAPRLVFSSESALADFRTLFPQHAEKGCVLRFATSLESAWFGAPWALEGSGVPERFFLISNQFWAHKNHLLVFAALRLLRARGLRPAVLCTGQVEDPRNKEYAAQIHAALAEGGLGEQVRLLGILSREAQMQLMRRALAVIQPSLFEGWSTVVEDARVLGRPCLLSDLAVHREQNPPGARFFPPDSAEALAALISETWEHGIPGPDLAAEATARAAAEKALAACGTRFLEIAHAVTATA